MHLFCVFDCDLNQPQDIVCPQRDSSKLLQNTYLLLRVQRNRYEPCTQALLELGGVEDWRYSRVREKSERETEWGVVNRERNRSTFGGQMLRTKRSIPMRNTKMRSGLTTVTSSPTTSTSGLRKCFRATIPARQAQSRRLPASARKCRVRRICHT